MLEQETFDAISHSHRSVKEMFPDEQPREKMMTHGAEYLSDAELLAILLRTGTKKMNVIETSRALLNHFDGLANLFRKNWQDLKVIPGIADVKAITLEASFELARRIQVAELGDKITCSSPEDVARYFAPRIKHLSKEVFLVAFLNNAKKLIGYRKVSSGGTTATIVEPAEIMRQAILNEANSIILIHNHPSGIAVESAADINLTKRCVDAGKLVGIPVDDHIIIARNKFVSFKSKGLIN